MLNRWLEQRQNKNDSIQSNSNFPSPCRWWKSAVISKLELFSIKWSRSYIVLALELANFEQAKNAQKIKYSLRIKKLFARKTDEYYLNLSQFMVLMRSKHENNFKIKNFYPWDAFANFSVVCCLTCRSKTNVPAVARR